MRKLISIALVAAFALTNVGCIAVVSTKGPFTVGQERQAVAMDGRIYLVDVSDGSVYRVSEDAVESAEVFVHVEEEVTD